MNRTMNHKSAVLLLVITSILWSFSGIGIKLMSWNGFAIAGLRSLLAASVMLTVVRRPRLPRSLHQIAAVLCYTGLVTLIVTSTKLTTAANAILLQYTAPVYSAALGYLILKEPVRRKDVITILMVLSGLVLFLYDGLTGGRMTGNLLALLSGVCYGAMNVFMRKGGNSAPAENVFWGNILTFLLMLPFMGQLEFSRVNTGMILFLGFFQLGLAYVLYTLAIPRVAALEATVITVLEPILSPVWVMIFYGEKPGVLTVVGGAIVLTAICGREILSRKDGDA